jgi:hypothetical protein
VPLVTAISKLHVPAERDAPMTEFEQSVLVPLS